MTETTPSLTYLTHNLSRPVFGFERSPVVYIFETDTEGSHQSESGQNAVTRFRAEYGQSEGRQGGSYAISTHTPDGLPLPVERIKEQVDQLIRYTHEHPNQDFFLAPIAKLLYTKIAPLFHGLNTNVNIPAMWKDWIQTPQTQTEWENEDIKAVAPHIDESQSVTPPPIVKMPSGEPNNDLPVVNGNKDEDSDHVRVATPATRYVAVIGTAGRDKTRPLTQDLWLSMCENVIDQLHMDDHVVSGGAAWADHLAVYAYLSGVIDNLTLFLPAPLERNEHGLIRYKELNSGKAHAASVANYYHRLFSRVVGYDTLEELYAVSRLPGVTYTSEPLSPGIGAMFARNKRVADMATAILAYTFDEGDSPVSGGTADTWNKTKVTDRTHVSLLTMISEADRSVPNRERAANLKPFTPIITPVSSKSVPFVSTRTVKANRPVTPSFAPPSTPVEPQRFSFKMGG